MDWEEYCIKKKIDSKKFQESESELWKELKNIFEQVHPNSFTEQKKFLINDLRRKYHLKEVQAATQGTIPVAKPQIKIAGI